jgi:hypothetical protein
MSEEEDAGATDDGDDRHGGGDPESRRHGWEPPRDPEIPLLRGGLDDPQGSQDDVVGRSRRTGLEPGARGAVETAIVGHAGRPSEATGTASASMAERSAMVA